MLTQGEDVEAHALREQGLVDLGHRPSPGPGPKDGPGLSERRTGCPASGPGPAPDPLAVFEKYLPARFGDDPHVWATGPL